MGVLKSHPIDHWLAPITKPWDFQMNNNLQCKTMLWTIVASLSLAAMPAYSQPPTSAQRDAIRSACRADYEAHCASVPPGGAASLQCLQQNMSALSSACQMAVRDVEPAAENKAGPKTENKTESKPETAPAAATSKPAEAAPAPAAKMDSAAPAARPSSAQVSAIRSACRSDYPKVCAGVPTGGAAALQCLEKNRTKLSASCEKAVVAASGGAAPAAAPAKEGATAAAPGAAPAPAAVIVLRPMRPREELFVLRSACGGDVRSVCGGVQPGGGRIVQCLARNAASLSPACKEVLAPFAAR
jgi:cysteine rich repeat protein